MAAPRCPGCAHAAAPASERPSACRSCQAAELRLAPWEQLGGLRGLQAAWRCLQLGGGSVLLARAVLDVLLLLHVAALRHRGRIAASQSVGGRRPAATDDARGCLAGCSSLPGQAFQERLLALHGTKPQQAGSGAAPHLATVLALQLGAALGQGAGGVQHPVLQLVVAALVAAAPTHALAAWAGRWEKWDQGRRCKVVPACNTAAYSAH